MHCRVNNALVGQRRPCNTKNESHWRLPYFPSFPFPFQIPLFCFFIGLVPEHKSFHWWTNHSIQSTLPKIDVNHIFIQHHCSIHLNATGFNFFPTALPSPVALLSLTGSWSISTLYNYLSITVPFRYVRWHVNGVRHLLRYVRWYALRAVTERAG